MTLPCVEKKELAPLTDAQVKDFLQVSAGDSLEIIMKVILFTGMRESEALGLTWDCVDFKAGTIKVCKRLQKRKPEDGGPHWTTEQTEPAQNQGAEKPARYYEYVVN